MIELFLAVIAAFYQVLIAYVVINFELYSCILKQFNIRIQSYDTAQYDQKIIVFILGNLINFSFGYLIYKVVIFVQNS